jgi:flavin reductase (DIM6/NTAB) family NADH-FMN oxidoreductase RutF
MRRLQEIFLRVMTEGEGPSPTLFLRARPAITPAMSAEATTSEYRTGSDPRTLRDALGCFATGVTIVTCRDPDGTPVGLTANSFTSVSLDPPLLLVCVAKTASSASALAAAGHFAVNVLQTGQQPQSIRFAARGEDRFGATAWQPGESGAPLLHESLGVFECRTHAMHDGGDHHIVIGEVTRASFDSALDPLLYFRGRYRRLHFD